MKFMVVYFEFIINPILRRLLGITTPWCHEFGWGLTSRQCSDAYFWYSGVSKIYKIGRFYHQSAYYSMNIFHSADCASIQRWPTVNPMTSYETQEHFVLQKRLLCVKLFMIKQLGLGDHPCISSLYKRKLHAVGPDEIFEELFQYII